MLRFGKNLFLPSRHRPVANAPLPPPAWVPFTLTAGDSGEWFGYSSGDMPSPPFNPPVGTISNPPSAAFDLEAIYYEMSKLVVVFHGDHTESLEGLNLQIDDEILMFATASYFAGNTWIEFAGGTPFIDGGTYTITFSN